MKFFGIFSIINTKFNLSIILLLFIYFFININIINAKEYIKYDNAKIQVLNKITGKHYTYSIPVNNIINIDNNLSLIVKVCYKTSQKYYPEDVIFLQVAKTSISNDSKANLTKNAEILNNANKYLKKTINKNSSANLIFSGWIFSNHPDLSSLNDPVYDITLIKCCN